MKKWILGLSCLVSLVCCSSEIKLNRTTSVYKLINTYDDVEWCIDYDTANLKVQIISYNYDDTNGLQYTIDKEWNIAPNKYDLVWYGVYGYPQHNNKFYEYNDYYLLDIYYKVS